MKRFHGLTPSQFDTLSRIAIGDDTMIHPKTAEVLLKKELVVARKETLGGRLPIVITRYDMPIGVHAEWCEFCAENFDECGEAKSEPKAPTEPEIFHDPNQLQLF